MDAVILIGIQATGKSTFYKKRYFRTHMRLSMDLLNTRRKEKILLDTCISLQQRIVIDNTNPTIEDRARYISELKKAKYKVVGYFFQSRIDDALKRNKMRTGKARIPELGIRATHAKLEMPSIKEKFDELYYVSLEGNDFRISKWEDEV